MRLNNLKTRIFLDSGDPSETKEAISLLGFLDGQTTNPSLIAKNPGVIRKIKRGNRFTKNEIYTSYKKIIQEISELIPQGFVSAEVYADMQTNSSQMIREAKEMFSWAPNLHIKLPITKEGLITAHQIVKQGMRVNMTLCFTQEQAAAVFLATKGVKRNTVLISPFIGRLDDIGKNGLSLISNILENYRNNKECSVEVLAASVRNLSHFLACLSLRCDIITAPFKVLAEWSKMGCPIPEYSYNYETNLENIPFKDFSKLSSDWKNISLENNQTKEGIEKFCADWKMLLK